MQAPKWLKPGFWGVVVGVIGICLIGFWGFGWTTASSAEKMAQERADDAVVAALVPFCVDKAQADPDAKLAEFGGKSFYESVQFVKDANWATLEGMSEPNSELARACSRKLQLLSATTASK
jgi:hypothetical protein